jgi:hypothetical protein
MKLIVAGSRDLLVDSELVDQLIRHYRLDVKEVVSGGSGHVDEAGEDYSTFVLEKEPKVFKANWAQEGVAAGPIRNGRMAAYADALLLIWDGTSKGSSSMKKEMEKHKKPIYEVILRVGI